MTAICFLNFALGQTIKYDGKYVKLDQDTEKKVSMMVDSLAGDWKLVKIIRYEKGDTILQDPSTLLKKTSYVKSFRTIRIDSLRNFEIKQACIDCPFLFWKGQYEIEIRTFNDLGLFYLNFNDKRLKTMKGKKLKKAFTKEFNGFVTNFENGEFTLTDKEETEWIYKRQ